LECFGGERNIFPGESASARASDLVEALFFFWLQHYENSGCTSKFVAKNIYSGRFAALIRLVEVLSSRSGPYTGTRPRFEDTLDAHWMVEPSNRPDQS